MIAFAILPACTTVQPTVLEKLDELTAVTITYGRTPMIMSSNTPYEREIDRDYVQIGAFEVNRMGTRQYYLWLGISDASQMASKDEHPNGFESITLILGSDKIQLDVLDGSNSVADRSG
jgi:hypothetical protein